ncbi:hypothetical protein INR49_023044, partial [Caranx melampygus]
MNRHRVSLSLSSHVEEFLLPALSFFSRGISFSLRNSAISLSSSRSLSLEQHKYGTVVQDSTVQQDCL